MAIRVGFIDKKAYDFIGESTVIDAKHVILSGYFLEMLKRAEKTNKVAPEHFLFEGYTWHEALKDLTKTHNLEEANLFAKEVSRTRTYARVAIFLDEECTQEAEFEFRIKREYSFKGIKRVATITAHQSAISFIVQDI